MLRVGIIYHASISAVKDRHFISKATNRKLNRQDALLFQALQEKSGPSTHGAINVIKSWHKAYKANTIKLLRIEVLNRQFKEHNSISDKIYNALSVFTK